MSLVHTFYFPLVFSRWCDQCEPIKGRFYWENPKTDLWSKIIRILHYQKRKIRKRIICHDLRHRVLVFLVLQTVSNPSFARKSRREESIWAAKSRELRRRASSLLVLRKIEETCTTANRSSARREQEKQHKLHMNIWNIYISVWNTNVCLGLKQNRIHVRIIKF